MNIGHREIDDGNPYFIAEAGVNHNGDLEMAEALIDAAADADADAVKFQTFSADRLVTRDAAKAEYQQETSGEGSQYEMLQNYELDRADHERLQEYCQQRGITFLSTPFDTDSADLLADLDVPAYKLGSGELDNHPLLEHVAEFGLPMIVSTGMSTMSEVLEARDAILAVDETIELSFLHCTSEYPCDVDDVNLRAMERMTAQLDEPVGYSDHTTLPETPACAVAAGAPIVEKHFTLDRTLPGPDHSASLVPPELEQAVTLARQAGRMRGDPDKRPMETELKNRQIARKSLHASTALEAGTTLTRKNLKIARPAEGLSPTELERVLGQELLDGLERGAPITAEDVDL